MNGETDGREALPDRERWNRRYDEAGMGTFGERPSAWLVRHEHLLRELSGGRALDIACGNGRNSIYLARLGFAVDALDVSDRAVVWTRARAAEEGLSVQARRIDLLRADPAEAKLEPGAYAVVVNINFLCRPLFPRIERALAPGGLLLFETFSAEQVELRGRRGRSEPRYALRRDELPGAFPSLRVLDYREAIVQKGGSGRKKGVASLAARREGRPGEPALRA